MGCLTGPYSCKGQVSSTFGHKLFLHTHTLLITMLFPCRHPILVYPALSFQFVPWREKKSVLLSLYLYVVGLFMWPCTTSRLMINVDVCCAKLFWLITFHWFHGYICLIPHRPLTSPSNSSSSFSQKLCRWGAQCRGHRPHHVTRGDPSLTTPQSNVLINGDTMLKENWGYNVPVIQKTNM